MWKISCIILVFIVCIICGLLSHANRTINKLNGRIDTLNHYVEVSYNCIINQDYINNKLNVYDCLGDDTICDYLDSRNQVDSLYNNIK